MNIAVIPFLIFGIFFIFATVNAYIKIFYHKKPKYPQVHYMTIFMLFSLGIMYILSAITNIIAIAILGTPIILLVYSWYRKRKYSSYKSYELDIKEKYPEIDSLALFSGIVNEPI
jgi:hypothetical protein